jgi:hypothetical protein
LLSKTLKNKIYRTVILPIILYGCETWLFTLREECRLRVPENILSKGDDATVEWRKLYNEVLNYLYSSPSIFQWIKSSWMR